MARNEDYILSKGKTDLARGQQTDVFIPRTIVALTLAAFLADYTAECKPGSMAYNALYMMDPSNALALVATIDADGKWYDDSGAEVT